jgi:DNA topoisomerase VI subunit B
MTRTTFQTPRVAEFASIKEMVTQTGHDPDEWLEVIVKELVDNGIDAAEAIDLPPVIEIWILADGIAVVDNGGGIAPEDVERMTDFTQRVSSNEAYVSPTRGKQGNALQTILAMPYLKDEQREPGKVTIDSRGVHIRLPSKSTRSTKFQRPPTCGNPEKYKMALVSMSTGRFQPAQSF